MVNGDISGEQWLELYRHLLNELEKRGHREVRAEIEAAASAPVVEESTPEDEARISKIVRGEVGKAVIRRRNPDEVFAAALGVLQSRLVEMPALAGALSKRLGTSPDRIEFCVDYEQRYALVQSDPVRLNQLIVSNEESESIRRELSAFGLAMTRHQG